MARSVNVHSLRTPGTDFHELIGWILLLTLGPLLILFFTVATYGLGPIIWLVYALTRTRKARALLHGSAVKVTPRQFPAIFKSASEIARSFGLKETPEVYIMEDNKQNAFATKHGAKSYVVLLDDVVHGAMATNNPKVLEFILAHEIAHHALGHTGTMRGTISSKYRPLSRLDEFSCDAVANAYVQDGAATRDALALLLVGPQLFSSLDRAALDVQAREVAADKYTKKAERALTHPTLLHRYGRILPSLPRVAAAPRFTEERAMPPHAPVMPPPRAEM